MGRGRSITDLSLYLLYLQEEELHRQRREKTLRKPATLFGFQLTPLQSS